jgi:hypothetical protein
MRVIVRRAMLMRGYSVDDIELSFKKLGNAFQNIEKTKKELYSMFGKNPLDENLSKKLKSAFEKRHPITHNLGVIDRKYMEHAKEIDGEGREVRLTEGEVSETLNNVFSAISLTYEILIVLS